MSYPRSVWSPFLSALATVALLAAPVQADLASNLQHAPGGAEGVMTLSTAYEDWRYFLTRKPFSDVMAKLQKDMEPVFKKELGIDFRKELLPMLGTHLNLAFYPPNPKLRGEFPALLVFDLRRTDGYPRLIQRLKATAAADKSKKLLETKYRGIPMYGMVGKQGPDASPYLALSGRTLLLGSKAQVMRAIDSGQRKIPSMAADGAFQAAQTVLAKDKFWLYANPTRFSSLLSSMKSETEAEEAALIAEMEEGLELYDSVGLGFNLNQNGLLMHSMARLRRSGLSPEKTAYVNELLRIWGDPNKPLRNLARSSPAHPLMFLGVDGLKLIRQGMLLFGGENSPSETAYQDFNRLFQRFTQLDFTRDLLANSSGRGGMMVFYPSNTQVFDRPPHVVMLLEAQDNNAMRQALNQKLRLDLSVFAADEASATKPEFIQFPRSSNATYSGVPLFVAQEGPSLQGLRESLFIQPSYAQVGNLWLFASNPDGLKAGIDHLQGKQASLTASLKFAQVRDRYGLKESGSLFYMDLSSTMKIVEFLAGEDEEVRVLKPTLNAFRSVIAGNRLNGHVFEGVLAIDLDMDKIDFELLGDLMNQPIQGEITIQR
ncbi:MAG: DUF3352 domain-containing protein [Candidatus Sericytochromatia bacterium]